MLSGYGDGKLKYCCQSCIMYDFVQLAVDVDDLMKTCEFEYVDFF